MNTQHYLERINYRGDLFPSLNLLSALQRAHVLSVPFENLDIHWKRPIRLDLAHLYEKIVVMRRGGFCYELNGLFHWLLCRLGFDATIVSAGVYDRDRNDYGPDFDHMAILVQLEGQQWLVDVGFGEFAIHPLRFDVNQELVDPRGKFRIVRESGDMHSVLKYGVEAGKYVPEYRMCVRPRTLEEFQGMCTYHQTSPDSHFTRSVVCSIATDDGRITLSNEKLIITRDGQKTEKTVNGKDEFARALVEYFHISM